MGDEKAKFCPICGGENNCAIANGQEPETCWCMTYNFSEKVRMKIYNNEKADGSACVCRNCVEKMELED